MTEIAPTASPAALQAEIERLRHKNMWLQTANEGELASLNREIERLRAALNELTTEITQSSVLMDNISLTKFERACAALEPKP